MPESNTISATSFPNSSPFHTPVAASQPADSAPSESHRCGALECLLTGLSLFAAYVAMGGYIAMIRGYIPGDALSRMVSAYLVFHGKETKLSSIGFVWPPLPTLIVIPFTLVEWLVDSWMAVVLVSAAFMAIAVVALSLLASISGLSRWRRRVLALLFATNPIMVVFAINGMSEAILIAVALFGFYWLVRFWQADHNGYMIMAGILFGLLPVIRYEMVLITAGAGLLVIVPAVFAVGAGRSGPPSLLQGRLIAFATLAAYPLVLWAIANWQIMDSPTYFLANDRSAISVASIDLAGTRLTLPAAMQIAVELWGLAYPMGLLASLFAVVVAAVCRSPRLLLLGLLPLVIPALQGLMLSRGTTVPLLRYFIMVVPMGFILLLVTWSQLTSGESLAGKISRGSQRPLFWIGVLFLLLSSLSSGLLLSSGRYQDIEHQTWLSLTARETVQDQRLAETLDVGRRLTKAVEPGSRILLDEYLMGYAIILGAHDPGLFMDHTDPNYEKALKDPRAYVDYLLAPSPEGRGALYLVNKNLPTLHSGGIPWAIPLDVLPPTQEQWRLFKVTR